MYGQLAHGMLTGIYNNSLFMRYTQSCTDPYQQILHTNYLSHTNNYQIKLFINITKRTNKLNGKQGAFDLLHLMISSCKKSSCKVLFIKLKLTWKYVCVIGLWTTFVVVQMFLDICQTGP